MACELKPVVGNVAIPHKQVYGPNWNCWDSPPDWFILTLQAGYEAVFYFPLPQRYPQRLSVFHVYDGLSTASVRSPAVNHANHHVNFVKTYNVANASNSDRTLYLCAFDFSLYDVGNDDVPGSSPAGWEPAYMIQTGTMSLGVEDRGEAVNNYGDILIDIVCKPIESPTDAQLQELRSRLRTDSTWLKRHKPTTRRNEQ